MAYDKLALTGSAKITGNTGRAANGVCVVLRHDLLILVSQRGLILRIQIGKPPKAYLGVLDTCLAHAAEAI